MEANQADAGRLAVLDRARRAFPWYDAARLEYFVAAVVETAYRGQRILGTANPVALPRPEIERVLALAIVDTVAERIHTMIERGDPGEGHARPNPR